MSGGGDLVSRADAFPLPLGVRSTETELDFSSATTLGYDEWETTLVRLGRVHSVTQWWIGDALAFGESRFRDGEQYQQALEATGRTMGSLYTLTWVSNSVPRDVRRADLSWSHHRAVARLTPDEQRLWLARAAEGRWSVDLLHSTIHASDRDLSTRRDHATTRSSLESREENEPERQRAWKETLEPRQLEVEAPSLREVVSEILTAPADEHGRICLDRNMVERLRLALDEETR